jgi:hypothetical protein
MARATVGSGFSQNRIAVGARHVQDRLALGLGVGETQRIETVVSMLRNNVRLAPGYWIQLILATGIATLGLALDSTAVVIGAMLVSPLMGPIIELGMGFAVGSSLLVMRAAFRVALTHRGDMGGADSGCDPPHRPRRGPAGDANRAHRRPQRTGDPSAGHWHGRPGAQSRGQPHRAGGTGGRRATHRVRGGGARCAHAA